MNKPIMESFRELKARILELETQVKWILVSESIPSDKREVDVLLLNKKNIIVRGIDRYDINYGFIKGVIYWKYQIPLPENEND